MNFKFVKIKILFLSFVFLFLFDNIHAQSSFGLNLGPDFGIKGYKSSGFIFNFEWNPHKHLGTRLITKINDGFWLGTACSFIYQTTGNLSKNFNWRFSFSIPVILKIKENNKEAFLGVILSNSIAISIDKKNKYFLVLTPAELFYSPFLWRMNTYQQSGNKNNIFVTANLGVRMNI